MEQQPTINSIFDRLNGEPQGNRDSSHDEPAAADGNAPEKGKYAPAYPRQSKSDASLLSKVKKTGRAKTSPELSTGGARQRRGPSKGLIFAGAAFLSLCLLSGLLITKQGAQANNVTAARQEAPVAGSVAPARQTAEVKQQPAPAESPAARPEEKTKPAAAAVPPGQKQGGEKFTVQVGSYGQASQAGERVARLKSLGIEARIVEADVQSLGRVYRVQVGRFGSREEAARFGAQLRARGGAQDILVTRS